MAEPVIETRALRKEFGEKVAVAELSLSVRRGEVFGFLGPNGAGKTTSLKMLLGLVRPSAGEGTVLGARLGDRATRARIGFLPEHFRFHEWLTGRELLRFHGQLYGMCGASLEARVDALLERLDLLDASELALRAYSKGMLQRVGLAQAMLNQPDLIFLDEPTSGLDPLGRLLVRDVIGELKRAGTTVFLNSHLLGEVEVTCDRVAFVKQGRTLREMVLAEHSPELEVDLRVDPLTSEVVQGLARFGEHVPQRNGSLRVRVPNEQALPEMARWVVERGFKLYQMSADRPSLESVFLEVMGDDQRPG